MCARPLSSIKRTKSPNFRMTIGELAMLEMKASIEGVGMSECVRRSVEAYYPTPRRRFAWNVIEICPLVQQSGNSHLSSLNENTH